jgi:hypothetical protein
MDATARRDGRRSSGNSHQVDGAVRLLHRRRGWAWTAGGSLIGLVVYVIIGGHFFQNLTGALDVISAIPVLVLLALVAAGLVMVIVDTVRLHRHEAGVRTSAAAGTSHHPLYAHAYRYPPRHRASWVFSLIMLVCLTIPAVLYLPKQVDGVAYLAGAGSHDTFVPVSYGQVCGRSSCSTVTDGFLQQSGADVTWSGRVPLGQSVPVRAPVWDWGSGRTLISGTGDAIGVTILGLFFDFLAVVMVIAVTAVVRHRLATWRGRAVPALT